MPPLVVSSGACFTAYLVGVVLQPVAYQSKIHLVVVHRAVEPFIGEHALPGGFADNAETPRQAAVRELREETGIKHDPLTIKETFWQTVGSPHRSGNDPRLPMLQFEVMPLVPFDTIDFTYTTTETQRVALVSYSEKTGDLVDMDGKPVQLCFSLHDQAAKNYLKQHLHHVS